MRKTYYLLLYFLILSGFGYGQESCNQTFGAWGTQSVPITGSDVAAVDVQVDASTIFTLNQIEVYLSLNIPPSEITGSFYNGELGNLMQTQDLEMVEFASTTPGIWKVTLNVPEPIELSGGSSGATYWIGLSAISMGEVGIAASDYVENENQPIFHSTDGGITWSSTIQGISGLIEGSIKIIGTCEEVEIPECSQSVPSNNVESGGNINAHWDRAVDVVVESNQNFQLEQMTLNVFANSGLVIPTIDAYFYEDNNGLPGAFMGSQLGIVPANDVVIGDHPTNPDFVVRQLTLDFDPVLFLGQIGEETHYWVRLNASDNIVGESVLWETTSVSTLGYKMAYWFNGELQGILQSAEGVYEIQGQCLPLDTTTACESEFYDTGGATGNYSNNENETWQIIPENGKVSSVEFVSFATEEGFDGLMVYDGPDSTYPIISSGFTSGNATCPNGAWTGTGEFSAEGVTFISTHPSGILTFVFTSNETNNTEGWEANVSCVEPGSAGNCLPGNLETSFSGNTYSWRGRMFNVTSLSDKDLEIRKFDINMQQGSKKTIEVYYHAGGFEGVEDTPSEWTLLGSQLTTGKGDNQRTELKVGGLVIPAGETYGIYITIADGVPFDGVQFLRNPNDHNTYSDEKISISPGLAREGGYFGEIKETDVVWSGVIYYCEGGEEQEYEQPCLNAEYGQYPSEVFEPGYYGYPEIITTIGWRGEYSKVRVTAGTEYTFSSSESSDFITISDELGVVALASGEGSVVWTADFDGVVRFYTHTDDACGQNNSSPVSRFVQCGELYVIEVPDFDCYFGDGLESNIEAGAPIQYQAEYVSADDFIIESPVFKAQQIRLNVFSEQAVVEARFSFLENIFGEGGEGPAPSPFLITEFIQPVSQVEIGRSVNNPSLKLYEVTFDLPEEIELTQGTYWLVPEVVGVNVFWEMTSTGSTGNYLNNGYLSAGMWVPVNGMNAVFFISGECEELGVSDINEFDFTYYPNPVKDVLNISAKKSIENVEIFNLSGQKVLNNAKVSNNRVDVNSLTSGTYIFRVSLEGGQVETFKIIKK